MQAAGWVGCISVLGRDRLCHNQAQLYTLTSMRANMCASFRLFPQHTTPTKGHPMLRSFDHLTPSRSPLRDSMLLRSPKLDALAATAAFTRCNSPPGGSPLGLSPHGGGGGMAPLAAVSPSSASRPMMERVEHLQSCMESMRAVLAEANKQLDEAQPGLQEVDGVARAQVQWQRGRGLGGGEDSALAKVL